VAKQVQEAEVVPALRASQDDVRFVAWLRDDAHRHPHDDELPQTCEGAFLHLNSVVVVVVAVVVVVVPVQRQASQHARVPSNEEGALALLFLDLDVGAALVQSPIVPLVAAAHV
jgi:hypothetical protein